MDSAKQQLVEKLKNAKNVLVTVSSSPTVDQLAALIGLSLVLNKESKHCAAVFSGVIPSTLEFLKPEDTIEKNTDSLRDFIIALDKNKADKLRYKVEDNIVRIFITPYRTSISQDDLNFSQGDFNVDVVVALGVHAQTDLDEVITAHGRILHDAVVASINISKDESGLGSIDWHDPTASSLSELVTDLAQSLGHNLLDEQIATALLTGIVSETERFSNDKTTPTTMSISAVLMSAGANQQLVATKLEEPIIEPQSTDSDELDTKEDSKDETPDPNSDDSGTLKISHTGFSLADSKADSIEDKPEEYEKDEEPKKTEQLSSSTETEISPTIELPEVQEASRQSSEIASLASDDAEEQADKSDLALGSRVEKTESNKLITEPPVLGGTLTSNAFENALEPSTDPFSVPAEEPPQLFERRADPFNDTSTASASDNTPPPQIPLPPATPLDNSLPPLFDNPPSDPISANTADDSFLNGIPSAPTDPVPSIDPTNSFMPPNPPAFVPGPPMPDSSTADTNNTGVNGALNPPSPAPAWPSATESPATSIAEPVSLTPADTDTLSEIEKELNSPHLYQSDKNETLSQLEEAVDSPHLQQPARPSDADNAREEVNKALSENSDTAPPRPIEALNAQPLGEELHPSSPPPVAPPLPFDLGKKTN